MANAVRRYLAVNSPAEHEFLLRKFKAWFDNKPVTFMAYGIHGGVFHIDTQVFHVKSEQGCLFFSEYPDFGRTFIVPMNDKIIVEDSGRITFTDEMGTLILISE